MQAKTVDNSVLEKTVFQKLGKTLVADADVSVGDLFTIVI